LLPYCHTQTQNPRGFSPGTPVSHSDLRLNTASASRRFKLRYRLQAFHTSTTRWKIQLSQLEAGPHRIGSSAPSIPLSKANFRVGMPFAKAFQGCAPDSEAPRCLTHVKFRGPTGPPVAVLQATSSQSACCKSPRHTSLVKKLCPTNTETPDFIYRKHQLFSLSLRFP